MSFTRLFELLDDLTPENKIPSVEEIKKCLAQINGIDNPVASFNEALDSYAEKYIFADEESLLSQLQPWIKKLNDSSLGIASEDLLNINSWLRAKERDLETKAAASKPFHYSVEEDSVEEDPRVKSLKETIESNHYLDPLAKEILFIARENKLIGKNDPYSAGDIVRWCNSYNSPKAGKGGADSVLATAIGQFANRHPSFKALIHQYHLLNQLNHAESSTDVVNALTENIEIYNKLPKPVKEIFNSDPVWNEQLAILFLLEGINIELERQAKAYSLGTVDSVQPRTTSETGREEPLSKMIARGRLIRLRNARDQLQEEGVTSEQARGILTEAIGHMKSTQKYALFSLFERSTAKNNLQALLKAFDKQTHVSAAPKRQ